MDKNKKAALCNNNLMIMYFIYTFKYFVSDFLKFLNHFQYNNTTTFENRTEIIL